MARNKIIYDVGFNLEKSSLNSLTNQLTQLKEKADMELIVREGNSRKVFQEQINTINEIERALQEAYNPKLNSISLSKFSLDLTQVGQKLNSMGVQGQSAFRSLTTELLTTNRQILTTNKFLDSMSQTFFSTLRWSVASGALSMFSSAFSNAWTYVKDLDQSLNNIRIVTGKSNEEMEKFAKNANKAAKALGSSTTDYTNASLIFYQQGLAEKEVKARTETTLKVANITKQSTDAVSEQLTAIWNGYKVSAQEAELYIDKVAAVAASTASDLEELSDGMSKVASMAQAMGVDIDQLNGVLSTVISVTRQDASVVGTAFKTIFARMGDLAVGGEDEFGVKLGEVSGKLQQMGIDVLDQTGNLRDMGTVIEEVAAKWDTWTEAQQQAAAGALAGKRQINNLLALFENWDMYESAVATSQNSAGTLQEQQDIYLDSLEAKFEKISTSAERLYSAIFDSESMKTTLDALSGIVDLFAMFTEGIGGGGNLLLLLGGIALRVFRDQVGVGLATVATNQEKVRLGYADHMAQIRATEILSRDVTATQIKGQEKILSLFKEQLQVEKFMTEEEVKDFNTSMKMLDQEYAKQDKLLQQNEQMNNSLKKYDIRNGNGKGHRFLSFDESGQANISDKDRIEVSKQLTQEIEKNSQSIEKNEQSIKALDNIKKGLNGTEKQQKQATEKLNSAIEKQLPKLKTLANSDKLSTEQKKRLKNSIKAVEDAQKKGGDVTKALTTALQTENVILNENQNELNQTKTSVDNLGKEIQETTKNINTYEKGAEEAFGRGKKSAKMSGITDMAGILTEMSFIITSLLSLIDTFTDAEASAEDKLLSFIMTLGMMVPMIVSFAKTLSKAAWSSLGPWAAVAAIVIGAVYAIMKAIEFAEDKEKEQQKILEANKKTLEQVTQRYEELTTAVEEVADAFDSLKDTKKKLSELAEGTKEWKEAVAENNQQIIELLNNYAELAPYIGRENGVLYIKEGGEDMLTNLVAANQKAAYGDMLMSQYLVQRQSFLMGGNADEAKDFDVTKLLDLDAYVKERRNFDQNVVFISDAKLKEDIEKEMNTDSKKDSFQEALSENVRKYKVGEISKEEALKNIRNSVTTFADGYEMSVALDTEDLEEAFNQVSNSLDNNAEYIRLNTLSLEALTSKLNSSEKFAGLSEEDQTNVAKIIQDKNAAKYQTALDAKKDVVYAEEASDNTASMDAAKDWAKGNDDVVADSLKYDWENRKYTYTSKSTGETVSVSFDKIVEDLAYKEVYEAKDKDGNLISDKDVEQYSKIFGKSDGKANDSLKTISKDTTTIDLSNFSEQELKEIFGGISSESGENDTLRAIAKVMNYTGDLSELKKYITETIGITVQDYAKILEASVKNENTSRENKVGNIQNEWKERKRTEKGEGIETTTIDKIISRNGLNKAQIEKIDGALQRAYDYGPGQVNALANIFDSITDPEQLEKVVTAYNSIDWTQDGALGTFIEDVRKEGINIDKKLLEGFSNEMMKVIVVTKEMAEEFNLTGTAFEKYAKQLSLTEGEAYKYAQATQQLTKVNDNYNKSLSKTLSELEDISNLNKNNKDILKTNLATDVSNIIANNKVLLGDSLMRLKSFEFTDDELKDFNSLVSSERFIGATLDERESILALWEEYQEYSDFSETEFIQEQIDKMQNSIVSGVNEMNNEYQKYQDSLTEINSLLKAQIRLQKLLKDENLTWVTGTSIKTNILDIISNNITQISDNLSLFSGVGSETDSNTSITEELRKDISSNLNETLSAIDDFYNQLQEDFEKSFDNTLKTLFNNQDFDRVSSDWEFEKYQNERYLDNVNSEYEVSKLSKEYEKIANQYHGNLSAQNKINSAMKTEIDLLNQKDKLSKADLDRARAKLEVLQAEIALEEARRNATQMQLVRDANGNYSYAFVADENGAQEAEQKLADAKNNLYNKNREQGISIQDEYMDLVSQYKADYLEALKIEDVVEREAQLALLNSQYATKFGNIKYDYQQWLAETAGKEEYADLFNEDIAAALNADPSAFFDSIAKLYYDEETNSGYKKDENDLKTQLEPLQEKLTEIKSALEVDAPTSGDFGIMGSISVAIKILNELPQKIAEELSKIKDGVNNEESNQNTTENGGEDKGDEEKELSFVDSLINWGSGLWDAIKNGVKSWLGFDTGGYTGEWGPEGRIAVLHQKELVLNAADTENILSTVSIVRSLGDIFSGLLSNADSFGNMPGLSSLLAQFNQSGGNSVAQSVLIEANFPNVTDKQEIQDAINNLISLAEQKANEKE